MTDPVEGSRLDAVKRSDAPAQRASDRLDTRLPRARQVRNAVVRLPAQAQQAVSEVVRMLAAVVGRLRTPLLVAVLLPVAAGVLLVAVSAIRGGADLPIACVLAVVGVVPSIWLAVRRAQLLRALQPPDEAGAEIYAALDVPAVWAQFKENLTQVAVQRNKIHLRSLAGSVWRGVRFSNELRNRVGDSHRLAPFLPGRLRGLVFLTGWCVASGVVLGGFLVLKVLTTAVGIG